MSRKVTPYWWFDGQAEDAARFYVSLLPDSGIERVTRAHRPTRRADRRAWCSPWSSRSPVCRSSA